MLTEQELLKIFSWQPYRENWTINRNFKKDNINAYYSVVFQKLTTSIMFETYQTEHGGLSNYLEFICYPKGYNAYDGNALLICISLCAPIAAYGQTTLTKEGDFIGWGGLFRAENAGEIYDPTLKIIESEIKSMLIQNNITLLDKDYACRRLPVEIIDMLKYENHNEGDQYLQGIFQKND